MESERTHDVSKVTLRLVSGKIVERYGKLRVVDGEYVLDDITPSYHVTKRYSRHSRKVKFRGTLYNSEYRRFPKENVEWVSEDETDHEVTATAEWEQLYRNDSATPNYRNDEVMVDVPDVVEAQQFE